MVVRTLRPLGPTLALQPDLDPLHPRRLAQPQRQDPSQNGRR